MGLRNDDSIDAILHFLGAEEEDLRHAAQLRRAAPHRALVLSTLAASGTLGISLDRMQTLLLASSSGSAPRSVAWGGRRTQKARASPRVRSLATLSSCWRAPCRAMTGTTARATSCARCLTPWWRKGWWSWTARSTGEGPAATVGGGACARVAKANPVRLTPLVARGVPHLCAQVHRAGGAVGAGG